MRLFDLVLALVVLATLVWIARKEFPSFEARAVPRPTAAASPLPSPPASGPTASPVPASGNG